VLSAIINRPAALRRSPADVVSKAVAGQHAISMPSARSRTLVLRQRQDDPIDQQRHTCPCFDQWAQVPETAHTCSRCEKDRRDAVQRERLHGLMKLVKLFDSRSACRGFI